MKRFYLTQWLLLTVILLFATDVYSQCTITRTITGNTPVCQYTTGTYTTESGMSGYSWSVTGGTIFSPGPPYGSGVIVYWSSSGSQSISVTYTDTNSCTSGTSKNVAINPALTPVITGNDNGCQNSTGNIYSTIADQSNYNWVISAGGTITSGQGTNSITVTWNATGNQTITLNYTGTNGCLSPVGNKSVNVSPLTASITGNGTPCISTQHAYTTQSGKSSYNWSVTGGSIQSGAGTSSINVLWNSLGPQSVSVSYSDPSSCIATPSVTQNITVTNPPTPTITGNSTPCQHTNYIYTTEPGMTSYSWNIPGSFASGVVISGAGTNSITVKWTGSGARSINVNYVSPGGCYAASPASYNVNVTPLPFPSISGPSTLCQGVSGTYSAAASQSAYNWSASGGTIISGAGTNTVNVVWNSAGTRTISLDYGLIGGCQTPSGTYSTTVNATPVPSIIYGGATLCQGTPYGYQTDAGQTSYNWTITSGGVITAGLGTNTITVAWSGTGPQTVGINYTNNYGCTAVSPTTRNETVYPKPVMTSPSTKSICSGYPIGLTLTSSLTSDYFWNVIDNPNTTNESSGSASSSTPILNGYILNTTSSPEAVSYSVTPRALGSFCMGDPQTVLITVNPRPTSAPLINGNAMACIGQTNVVYTTDAGYSTYPWTINGGVITSGYGTNSIEVTWNTSGSRSVSVQPANSFGCSSSFPATKGVTVGPVPPGIIANGATTICEGGSVGLQVTSFVSSTTYQWMLNGVNISGATTGSHTATQAGDYTVRVKTVFVKESVIPLL